MSRKASLFGRMENAAFLHDGAKLFEIDPCKLSKEMVLAPWRGVSCLCELTRIKVQCRRSRSGTDHQPVLMTLQQKSYNSQARTQGDEIALCRKKYRVRDQDVISVMDTTHLFLDTSISKYGFNMSLDFHVSELARLLDIAAACRYKISATRIRKTSRDEKYEIRISLLLIAHLFNGE